MKASEVLVGIIVFLLCLLAPDALAGLVLTVLGFGWLNCTFLGFFNPARSLAALLAGAGISAGLKLIWRGLREE